MTFYCCEYSLPRDHVSQAVTYNERRADFVKLLSNNYKNNTHTDTNTDGRGGFTKAPF
jgi:hypothetical protein